MKCCAKIQALCLMVLGLGVTGCVTAPDDAEIAGGETDSDVLADVATGPVGPRTVSVGSVEYQWTTSVPVPPPPCVLQGPTTMSGLSTWQGATTVRATTAWQGPTTMQGAPPWQGPPPVAPGATVCVPR